MGYEDGVLKGELLAEERSKCAHCGAPGSTCCYWCWKEDLCG